MHFSQHSTECINHDLKISEDDFKTILKFIYSSEVLFKAENFFSLVSEASFYMIDSEQFYDACFEHFQSQVCTENISTLSNLSEQYTEMTSVKSCLLEFIKSNWPVVKNQVQHLPASWITEMSDFTALYDVD